MNVERYSADAREAWDEAVRESKNGTFLFLRDYMEHHRDRFEDHSLIVRDRRGRPSALLPANRREATIESHGGLTYGGFVVDRRMTTLHMREIVPAVVKCLRADGFTTLRYRAIPYVYHAAPAQEDLFVLSRLGARLVRRSPLSVLDLQAELPLQTRRRRSLAQAARSGSAVEESGDLATYWRLLSEVLLERYGSSPVHTLAEIEHLRERFPSDIRLFACMRSGRMVAGVLVYDTPRVARAQYIAASAEGRETGALDLLFQDLRGRFGARRYLDLGTSEGQAELGLNDGVIDFKEGLGARTVAQDTYELSLD